MNKIIPLILVLLFCCVDLSAQRKNKKQKDAPVSSKDEIIAFTSNMKLNEGFVSFYYDEKNGKIYLLIDRLDEEFLYVNSLPAGIGSNDIGLDRGQLGSDRVVKFERYGNKVMLVQPNYSYRALSDNASEVKAVKDAFAQSVLWGFSISKQSKGKILLDATDFFLRDAHGVSRRLSGSGQGNYRIDKSRSALYPEVLKAFPDNTEIEALLTFTGQANGGYIRSVTPTSGAVTVRQRHSFIRLPDDQYSPREFDPRAGYFSISFMDYATPIDEPIRKRWISRHRLKKKNPQAAVSEAVEPIIYYLDPGVPEPVRSALLEGARWWNQAFESAGYKDAFQVKMLPEDADPMDVRYNVIQWVHRSTRGWSYGASVTDPRTGEIIKGHVSLGSLRVRQDFLIAEGLLAPYDGTNNTTNAMKELALARLRQLSAHEVGHTIGLAHSYASSTEGRASVMDYPHPLAKLVNGQIDLSDAYDDKIGEWDKVAVQYGYQDFGGRGEDRVALDQILQDGLKKGLSFISDQDARPQSGAHPYAHLWDNANDPVAGLEEVMEVRAVALNNFGEKNIKPGMPMATLEEVLVPIYFYHRYQTEAVVKIIGGLNYRYALRGDGQVVTEYVSPEWQKKAMDALMKTLHPDHLALPEKVLTNLPPRPLGYSRGRELIGIRTGLTFDALAVSETAADMTLGLLLNPARVNRLVEFNARNSTQPGLKSVLNELIDHTWKAKNLSGFNGAVQQSVQNRTLQHLFQLGANERLSPQASAQVMSVIASLKKWINTQARTQSDKEWREYYSWANDQIANFEKNPGKFKTTPAPQPPAGSPIGSCGY